MKDDIERAKDLRVCGEKFINSSHYAIDCIRPKCFELQRICTEYADVIKTRFTELETRREFQEESAKVSLSIIGLGCFTELVLLWNRDMT